MTATSVIDSTLATPQVLVSQALAVSESAQYTTAAANWVKIGSATLTNTGTSSCPVALSVVKSGGTAGASNRVLSPQVAPSLAPGDSTIVNELVGVFLGPGDFISGGVSAMVQVVTVNGSPTSGTFTLTVVIGGVSATTTAIAFNASLATVQSAIQALSNVPANGVVVTGSGAGFPYTVTFPIPQVVSVMTHTDSLSGGTAPNVSVTAPTFAVALVISGVVYS